MVISYTYLLSWEKYVEILWSSGTWHHGVWSICSYLYGIRPQKTNLDTAEKAKKSHRLAKNCKLKGCGPQIIRKEVVDYLTACCKLFGQSVGRDTYYLHQLTPHVWTQCVRQHNSLLSLQFLFSINTINLRTATMKWTYALHAYIHYNFSSVSIQWIFQQLSWSEFRRYMPADNKPKPLLMY
jgi:hypothetical protein